MDLNKNEEEILGYWKEQKIMQLVREKNKGRKPFYFLDGPPFVSGDLHPGQMWVKSMKDVELRYRRFRGYDVYDRAGYDVHGLPIEKRAEAQLGIKSKKEIESRIGIENFIKACNDYVNAYIGRMDADYERFGVSLDFSNPYVPSTKGYMETEWGMLKQIYEKGLLYKDLRSTPYCTSCETAVSQGSTEVEYKDDEDPSLFIAFKANASSSRARISGDVHLLVWTTTPWTLPANIAVAANPKELYVLAKLGHRRYILIKSRLDAIAKMLGESAVVEGEFYGSELQGLEYHSPLEGKVPKQKEFSRYHKVVMAEELVSKEEGSGLVHIAPGHGLEDYLVGKKNKFPIFSPVDMHGNYTEEAGAYSGLKVPEQANKQVLADLMTIGAVVSESKIRHSYPHCWRCDTKLIFMATKQWFVNIQKVKKKILSENRKVSWHPEEAQKWQEDVLQGSPDWTLSRQRYWGVPMPIWECEKCGELNVIGSIKELRELAIDKNAVDALADIHRPHIDKILIKCRKCGGEVPRIKDVLDVWFDSGIAYRASLTEEQFEKLFPMDFILEGVDQLRAWFSYQIKVSTIVNNKRPFENVATHGMMLGADGREMHKKLGNYVPLQELIKTTTADSFRLWCTSHAPQLDLYFSTDKIGEANKAIKLLYNISNLYQEYSDAAGYRPKKAKRFRESSEMSIEDAWILSRMNSCIKTMTESLDNYDIYKGAAAIKSFMTEDFSRIYLRMAKKRILYSDRKTAKATLEIINYLLFNTIILIAPYTPFAAEKTYLENYAKKSAFLEDWPKFNGKLLNKELEDNFDIALDAITAILYSREKENIKLRQPLTKATIEATDDNAVSVLQKLAYIIEDYTNIKHLEVKRTEAFNVEIKPSFGKIGPDFKEKANAVAEALKGADPDAMLKEIEKTGYYQLHTDKGPVQVRPEHFTVIKKMHNESAVQFKHGVVFIDKEISKELQEEAIVREFERAVQVSRKELQLKKVDKISLHYSANKELSEIISANGKMIKKDVNAKELKGVVADGAAAKEFDIEGNTVRIAVSKI